MYCPKCAQPNADDAKFCRACGENLTVVAQAMAKHLPLTLVSKLDEHIEKKHNRLRRDSILTGLSGVFLLLSGIWMIVGHQGSGISAVFMFVGALLLFLASAWDMLAYQRTKSRQSIDAKSSPPIETGKLEASGPRQIPAASVTEQTTRHLDPSAGR
ncbi:MAG TPA: zinc ribbon domain-containing protein [Pyrinomonadaceae bacterium]|jgi:zinc-ribbon domain